MVSIIGAGNARHVGEGNEDCFHNDVVCYVLRISNPWATMNFRVARAVLRS